MDRAVSEARIDVVVDNAIDEFLKMLQ